MNARRIAWAIGLAVVALAAALGWWSVRPDSGEGPLRVGISPYQDIAMLVNVLNALVDAGNSVLVIEHNLDVVACADWVIDLGPDGGDRGGRVVACGTPEEIAKVAVSHTGRYLREILQNGGNGSRSRLVGHQPAVEVGGE